VFGIAFLRQRRRCPRRCSSRTEPKPFSRVSFPPFVAAQDCRWSFADLPFYATRMSARVSSPELANSILVAIAMGRTKLRSATRRERERERDRERRVTLRDGWKLQLQVVARCWLNLRADRICLPLSPFRALFLYPSFLLLPLPHLPCRRIYPPVDFIPRTPSHTCERAHARSHAISPIFFPSIIFLLRSFVS